MKQLFLYVGTVRQPMKVPAQKKIIYSSLGGPHTLFSYRNLNAQKSGGKDTHKYLNILKYGRYMNIPSHPHIKHIFSKGYLCRPPPHPKKDLVSHPPPTSTNLFLSCKIASSDRGVPAESTTLYIIHGSWLGNVYIYLIFKIVHPLNVFIYIHIYRYSLSNAIYHRHWQDSLGRGGGGGGEEGLWAGGGEGAEEG